MPQITAMALVRCGISLDDFDRLTPTEWDAVAVETANMEQRREQLAWQRARMTAYAAVSPYTRQPAHILFPLPWDKTATNIDHTATTTDDDIQRMIRKYEQQQS